MKEQPVISHEVLMAQFDGDRELLVEVGRLFVEDYPRQIEEIREALASGDPERVELAAHTLKGAVSNFASAEASASAAALEEMGRDKELDGGERALARLEFAMQRLDAELRAFLD